MSITSHLQELRRKHENLSHMVESEQRSPGSDALKIAEGRNHPAAIVVSRPFRRWRAPPVPHRQ